jgi:hypothetical protein
VPEQVWDDELTIELARTVVADVSPGELEVFDLLAEGYREDGISFENRGDGALGFGADVIETAVAAIPIAQAVRVVLEAAAADLVKEGAVAGYRALMRRRLRSKAGGADSLPDEVVVPDEVVLRARQTALQQASSIGLPPEKAHLLANAIAGALSTSPR